MKTLLITQARMGSSRLPGKILKEIKGNSLLKIHLDRLRDCKNVSDILVATTVNAEDKIIYDLATEWGFKTYRGSEEDVLDRFYKAAKSFSPKWVVRVTSDCPLIDPRLVDSVIEYTIENNKDYGANILEEIFPDGQDVEVFSFSALERAWEKADKKSEREHVTPFIRNNSDFLGGELFSAIQYPSSENFNEIRMTVDEQQDFELIKMLVEKLGPEKTWKKYTSYIIEHGLKSVNENIKRNEGLLKSLEEDRK